MNASRRFLLVCADDAQPPRYSWQIRRALELLGWEVQVFNYRFAHVHRTTFAHELISSLLLRRVRTWHPEAMLVIKGEALVPGTIRAIREQGVVCANWTLDEPFGMYGRYNNVRNVDEYDAFFIFDDHYVAPLQEKGATAHYLPIGSEPLLFHEQVSWENRRYECDASLVASHHPNREAVLTQLADLDLKVYGYRWNSIADNSPLRPRIQSWFPTADKTMSGVSAMVRIWNLSRCNINVHHPQARNNGVNFRVFDLMATRSFQLCDTLPGIGDIVNVGKDLIVFSTPAELRHLIAYYAQDVGARLSVVERGYDALVSKHRTLHRVKEMLRIMNV